MLLRDMQYIYIYIYIHVCTYIYIYIYIMCLETIERARSKNLRKRAHKDEQRNIYVHRLRRTMPTTR